MRKIAEIEAAREETNIQAAKANADILASCARTIEAELKKPELERATLKMVATVLHEEAANFLQDAKEHQKRRQDFLKIVKEQR